MEYINISGYVTRSILAAPILDTEGNLYGVIQLINKVDGIYFSTTDQKSFEVFTIYCSLNIRYIKVS